MPQPAAPATELRQRAISLLVETDGFVRVRDLSERFGVSVVTVRSDLAGLEANGRLRRVRGGAVPRFTGDREVAFELAREEAAEAKGRIARRAVSEVSAGDTAILDVGTTTHAVACELVARTDLSGLTVFTSSLTIALELERAADRIEVVVTGGTLRPLQHSLVQPLATVVLEGIHAHVAFIGCNGIHPGAGVTNVNLPEAEVKAAMIRASRRCVVVADGSKVGEVELARVCPLGDVDLLVTDDTADPAAVADLRGAGLEVALIGPGS